MFDQTFWDIGSIKNAQGYGTAIWGFKPLLSPGAYNGDIFLPVNKRHFPLQQDRAKAITVSFH